MSSIFPFHFHVHYNDLIKMGTFFRICTIFVDDSADEDSE